MPQLLKPLRLEPVLRNKRGHCSEKPAHCNEDPMQPKIKNKKIYKKKKKRSRQQGGIRHVRDLQGGTPVREKGKEPERVGEPSDHVQF